MSLFKNSKFWSNLALIASILCIASMLFSLIGIRQEWFSTGMPSRTCNVVYKLALLLLL